VSVKPIEALPKLRNFQVGILKISWFYQYLNEMHYKIKYTLFIIIMTGDCDISK
jgi:hypothetical protein